MRISVILITLWILVFSAGCQANPVEGETTLESISTPVAPPDQGETTQMSPSIPTPADAGSQNLIEKAKTNLAQRLAISVDQIVLLEATSVVWPDSSLGCSSPGSLYTQVLTPGYLIRLEALGGILEYHTNKGDLVIYCANPSPPLPSELLER